MHKAAHNGCCRRSAQIRALASVLGKRIVSENLSNMLLKIESPLVRTILFSFSFILLDIKCKYQHVPFCLDHTGMFVPLCIVILLVLPFVIIDILGRVLCCYSLLQVLGTYILKQSLPDPPNGQEVLILYLPVTRPTDLRDFVFSVDMISW